jgi:hypothetical protein
MVNEARVPRSGISHFAWYPAVDVQAIDREIQTACGAARIYHSPKEGDLASGV